MATVDALIVEIRANNEKFEAALKSIEGRLSSFESSTNSSLKKIETQFDRLASTVDKVKTAFAAIAGAAAIRGLVSLGEHALAVGEAYADMAQKTGISAAQLSRLALGAQQAGVPLEFLSGALAKFNKAIVQGQQSTSDQAKAFTALGISAQEMSAGLQNPEQLLLKVASAFAKSEDGATKTAVAMTLFGKAGAELIPFLNQGAAGIREMADTSERLGLTWTNETAAAADQLSDNILFLKSSISGIAQSVLQEFLPSLNSSVTNMLEWVKTNREWISTGIVESFAQFAQGARDIAPSLAEIGSAAASLLRAFTSLPPVVQEVGIVGALIGGKVGLALGVAVAAFNRVKEAVTDHRHLLDEITGVESNFSTSVLDAASALGFLDTAGRKSRESFSLLSGSIFDGSGKWSVFRQGVEETQKTVLSFSLGTDEAAKKAKSAGDALRKAREDLIADTAVLNTQADILQDVIDGRLSMAEATARMAAVEKGAKVQSDALTQSFEQATARLGANRQAIEEQNKAIDDLVNSLTGYKQALDSTVQNLQQEAQAQQVGLAALKGAIAEGKNFEDAQKAQAKAIELTTFWWNEYQKALALKGPSGNQIFDEEGARRFADELTVLKDRTISAREEAEQYGKTYREAIDTALLKTSDLEQVITGILTQGPKKLGDIAEAFGQTMGVRLIKGILFGKGQNEQAILGNFNQLLGIDAAGIFGQQGINLGNSLIGNIISTVASGARSLLGSLGIDLGSFFGSSFNTGASDLLSDADFLNEIGLPDLAAKAGAQSGFSFGSAFGNIALGVIGNSLGSLTGGLFGLGKSSESSIGGNVGGLIGGIAGSFLPIPGGALVGSFIGNIFGSIFGSLFEHIPTKGTQVRKSVVEFLKDIKASFAEEINSKNYFFEETKSLAQQMFGGDFLAASKQVLLDKAGPELASQLKALGTFITADQAAKLGKPIEQTGTTFGNLLIANLGIDRIPDAIKEIVQKGNINLGDLTDKLNKLFLDNKISADFFKDAIAGAVSIFTSDLPAAIDASAIALKSFAEDGTFDLEKFQKSVQAATDQLSGISQVFTNALTSTDPEAFGKGLDDFFRSQLISKFASDKLEHLFDGIDLTQPITKGSDAAALLQSRFNDAHNELLGMLDAAGLLPEEMKKTTDETEKAADAMQTLADAFAASFDNVGSNLTGAVKSFYDQQEQREKQLQDLRAKKADVKANETDLAARSKQLFDLDQQLKDLEAQQGTAGEALGNQIAQNFAAGFSEGLTQQLVQANVIDAVLAPVQADLKAKSREFFSDGILTAKEQAELANIASTGVKQAKEAAESLNPALDGINSASKDIAAGATVTADKFVDIKLATDGAATNTEAIQSHIDDTVTAAGDFVDKLHDAGVAGDTIADKLEESLKSAKAISLTDVVTQALSIRDALIAGATALNGAQLNNGGTGKARGGWIPGYGGGDRIPIMAEAGEFVVNKDSTRANFAMLQAINDGVMGQHFASGGRVRRRPLPVIGTDPRGPDIPIIGTAGGRPDIPQAPEWLPDEGDVFLSGQLLLKKQENLAKRFAEQLQTIGGSLFRDSGPNSALGRLGKITEKFSAGNSSFNLEQFGDIIKLARSQFDDISKERSAGNRLHPGVGGLNFSRNLHEQEKKLTDALNAFSEAAGKFAAPLLQAADSLQGTISNLLQGPNSPLNAFEKMALLAQQEGGLRATLAGGGSSEEKAKAAQDLATVLTQKLDLSPFDKFGLDFREQFASTLNEISQIQQSLRQQAGAPFAALGLPLPAGATAPSLSTRVPQATQNVSATGSNSNVSITVTLPPGALDSSGNVQRLNQELLPEIERVVHQTIGSPRGKTAIRRIARQA